MRQIVLDTETTGIGHEQGHKVIEIGCMELIGRKLTGKHFHVYLNPERSVDEGAFKVHGISNEFLQDKPLFAEKVSEFLDFIADSELIIHNAEFDVGFLNAELRHIQWSKKLEDYCSVFDTLIYARKQFPGQRNSLDALCKRFGIDHFNRQLHGALLDAEILACVYLALTGGQSNLFSEIEEIDSSAKNKIETSSILNPEHSIILQAQTDELKEHDCFIEFLKKKSEINYWD
jgi:DNA polymerase-3 subunit epsilon